MTRVAREMIGDESHKPAEDEIRVPLYEQAEQIRVVNKDSSYSYRIVTKKGNRIERFKLAGWRIVTDPKEAGQISDINSNISLGDAAEINAGIYKDNGEPIRCILMKIRKEYKEETDAHKQKEQDKVMEAIYRGDTKEGSAKGAGITATAKVEEALHRQRT